MGEQGSVSWMFDRKSQVIVDGEKATEDQLMGILLDAGADDIRDQGGAWEILSPPEAHEAILKALEEAGIPTESAEIAMIPKNTVKLEGKNATAMHWTQTQRAQRMDNLGRVCPYVEPRHSKALILSLCKRCESEHY